MAVKSLWPKGCSCPRGYDCEFVTFFGPRTFLREDRHSTAMMECGNLIDIGKVNAHEIFEWSVPEMPEFTWTIDEPNTLSMERNYKTYTMIRFFFNGSLEWVDGSEGTEFL